MRTGRVGAGRPLERLFSVGAVGGLSDAELLERFADGDEGTAGAAFEAIVARHGPMVLRVCRMTLRDAHAAEDAFQATFLVLARRARGLDDRERLGNWLYGVALRTSRKARIAGSRRAARDRVAAGNRPEAIAGPTDDDRVEVELGRVLHEEIGRLPDSYRAAVVACYLEGLTQAEAATRLRLSESTVRGRLARARKRLGDRLARRGVLPSAATAALDAHPASAAAARLPDAIARSVARDALHFARSAGPASRLAVTSTAAALADGVLSTMWLPSIKNLAIATVMVALGLGIAASAGVPGRPPAGVAAVAPTSGLQEPGDAGRPKPSPKPKPKPGAAHSPVPPELAKRAPGPILEVLPASKDQMVLSYMPDWSFGRVDNIGIGNSGSRTLIQWPRIPDEEGSDPERRFVLAVYSRKTFFNPPAGPIVACEALENWTEQTSWNRRPRYDPEPFATFKFEPGEGWKLFDVTPIVRAQAKTHRAQNGVVLRFLSEDMPERICSTYFLVSREGADEWAARRPLLLVVEDPTVKPLRERPSR